LKFLAEGPQLLRVAESKLIVDSLECIQEYAFRYKEIMKIRASFPPYQSVYSRTCGPLAVEKQRQIMTI
jgi:hypothetical protein